MNPKRAGELFAQAIDLPAAERSGWIAEQCRGDEALRADVERLLRADAMAQDFMEQSPVVITDAGPIAADTAAPTAFGVYRVVRSIGQGGMGEVWLAERDDGEFEQRVAVKRIAYPTPGLLQRFRQERQILARLEHPNVARLIDGGLDANGIPYLAMEYVEGVPITEYARNHGLDVTACLRLFLRVCEAVQYAHQNLIVHRDLKPSNIFVIADGTPKLLDFGIAKVLTATDTGEATHTIARLLTPDYAAPEQFSGGAITTATDVYALGVVLYELLTEKRPHRRASTMTAPETDPLAPSGAIDRTAGNASARRRALRGDLDRIVLTAMARDATHRYASAEALAADIRRYLEGRPITARGDSAVYRVGKFARRNRYALGAAVLVIAVCIAATAISLRQAQRASEQAARAQAARQFLVGVFEQAGPDENKGKLMTAHQLLEKGERQLAGRFVDQPATRADVTGLIGGLYWNIGDYERALALLKEAESLTDDPRVPDEVNARILVTRASIELYNKNNEVALQHAQQALGYAERAGTIAMHERSDARREIAHAMLGMTGVSYANGVLLLQELLVDDRAQYGNRSDAAAKDLNMLGIALQNAGRYTEAIDASEKALDINRVLYGERSAAVSDNLFYIGMALRMKEDPVNAESALSKVVAIRSEIYGADHPETIDARAFLLLTKEGQGRYAEALQERLRLLDDQLRFRESNPNMIADAYNMLGDTYNMLGRPVEAEHALRESLATWAKKQGTSESARSRRPLSSLATALQLQGRYAEAEAAQRKVLAIASVNLPPRSGLLNSERGSLGNLLRLQHRYPEALTELREAVATIEGDQDSAKSYVVKLYAQLAEAELDAGYPQRARAAAAHALELGRASLPKGNHRLGYPLFALARVELAQEQADAAEPLLREALAVRNPPHPADDPRVLEVKVGLVDALTMLGKTDEAQALRGEIEPLLKASPPPYANELIERLAKH